MIPRKAVVHDPTISFLQLLLASLSKVLNNTVFSDFNVSLNGPFQFIESTKFTKEY